VERLHISRSLLLCLLVLPLAMSSAWAGSSNGATLDFSTAPPRCQARCFLALCVLCSVSLTFALYRLRVHQIQKSLSARFDERLAERTQLARDFHDTFLQTLQGSKLVAEDALEKSSEPVQMRRALEQLSG
jgi:signal transduction histidine kinase